MPRLVRLVRLVIAPVLLFVTSPLAAQAPGPAPDAARPDAPLQEASRLFRQGSAQPTKFADAARYFAAAFQTVEMSPEQLTAWAYCRVRVANDRLAKAGADPAVAGEVLVEVEDALRLAPGHEKLQTLGASVLAEARQRGGVNRPTAPASSGEVIETANFVIRHGGARAAAVASAAEEHRAAILRRWAGNATAAWVPKCEIVLHASAAAFRQATGQAESSRGQAVAQLAGGQVTSRQLALSLEGDEATLLADVLPRELSSLVVAGLFPVKAPPRWAELGMAVLAASDAEQARYRQALARCAEANTLLPLARLMPLAAPPADRATEFHAESASLVYFLVKWKGERELLTFVNLASRYGQEGALRQIYGVEGFIGLEAVWKRSTLRTP